MSALKSLWKSNWRWIVSAYLFGAVVLPLWAVISALCSSFVPVLTSLLFAQPIVIVTIPFIEQNGIAQQNPVIAIALVLVLGCTLSGLSCVLVASLGVLGIKRWKRVRG